MIAADLVLSLEDLGVSVVGPAGSVADALALVAGEPALDAAVLDVNLGKEKIDGSSPAHTCPPACQCGGRPRARSRAPCRGELAGITSPTKNAG